MLLLSSADVAIRQAAKAGTLRIVPGTNRSGEPYYAVEDNHGIIEACGSLDEATRLTGSAYRAERERCAANASK